MLTQDGKVVCDDCGQELAVGMFPWCNGHGLGHGYKQGGFDAAVHPRERTVVYENPETGKIRYPGRADVPIPERYRQQGYVKREFTTRRELEHFEKQNRVLADHLWCNSGNTLCPENQRND